MRRVGSVVRRTASFALGAAAVLLLVGAAAVRRPVELFLLHQGLSEPWYEHLEQLGPVIAAATGARAEGDDAARFEARFAAIERTLVTTVDPCGDRYELRRVGERAVVLARGALAEPQSLLGLPVEKWPIDGSAYLVFDADRFVFGVERALTAELRSARELPQPVALWNGERKGAEFASVDADIARAHAFALPEPARAR
jgi:hypothetical protein